MSELGDELRSRGMQLFKMSLAYIGAEPMDRSQAISEFERFLTDHAETFAGMGEDAARDMLARMIKSDYADRVQQMSVSQIAAEEEARAERLEAGADARDAQIEMFRGLGELALRVGLGVLTTMVLGPAGPATANTIVSAVSGASE